MVLLNQYATHVATQLSALKYLESVVKVGMVSVF